MQFKADLQIVKLFSKENSQHGFKNQEQYRLQDTKI